MKPTIHSQSGTSIIEIVLVAGMLGVISLGMVSMFESQNKQVKVLNQKQESLDLKNILLHCPSRLISRPRPTALSSCARRRISGGPHAVGTRIGRRRCHQ